MVNIIPPIVKKLYDEWNIQGFIMISLLLQTILVLFAPLRKQTKEEKLLFMISSANMLADWVAGFAVGLISDRQDSPLRREILSLWAPFLLLHLGGSDAINAFPLEDNALWLRHLVGLVVHVIVAVLVLAQTFPGNKLWFPTILVFLAGSIKNAERMVALYKANSIRFRESLLREPDPGPNYATLTEAYISRKEAKLPTQIELIPEPKNSWKPTLDELIYKDEGNESKLDEVKVVQCAYHFFEIFKGHIVDLIFSFQEREESRMFFRKTSPLDAFRLLAVELNFIYDTLYTKVHVTYSRVGNTFRFIYWCAVFAALLIFNSKDKQCFEPIDVHITYTLLYSAVGLDAIAFLRLVFSDWTIAYIQQLSRNSEWRCLDGIFRRRLSLKKINWSIANSSSDNFGWPRKILFRRWSESLKTFNLIDYCLQERQRTDYTITDRFCRKLIMVIGETDAKNFYDKCKYVKDVPIEKELWKFIFTQLKRKSDLVIDTEIMKKINSARGDWAIQCRDLNDKKSILMSYVVGVDFDQSLLIWHIATDLCSARDKANKTDDHYKISTTLSDYLLYLLIFHPTMMFSITGITHIRYRDTCAEAKRFFNIKGLEQQKLEKEHELACEEILAVKTVVKPVTLKGDKSKSVLFDACILAKELLELETKERWELMSEVWVELLSYVANQCKGNVHATQLSKGGELITFVWLLMAHLGLGDHFQTNEGSKIAKVVVRK